MYTAKINEQEFTIEAHSSGLKVDGKDFEIDIAALKNGDFHVLHNHASYAAEVLSIDAATKAVVVRVNGNSYTVGLKDQFDALLHQLGMDTMNSTKVNDIKAPMPGLVLKVLVAEGEVIKKGDGLLILEAMKMENIIKAPTDSTIKAIKIKPTDKVEKNQILINLG